MSIALREHDVHWICLFNVGFLPTPSLLVLKALSSSSIARLSANIISLHSTRRFARFQVELETTVYDRCTSL